MNENKTVELKEEELFDNNNYKGLIDQKKAELPITFTPLFSSTLSIFSPIK